MNNLKDLIDAATSKDEVQQTNDFDTWLSQLGYYDKESEEKVFLPACYLLQQYMKANKLKHFSIITSRIVFKSVILSGADKKRININNKTRPTGYSIPKSLFNPNYYDIKEAIKWWQKEKKRAKNQRERKKRTTDSINISSPKSNKNTTT